MKRLVGILGWVAGVLAAQGRCTCDPRFAGVAYDVDCPRHGLGSITA